VGTPIGEEEGDHVNSPEFHTPYNSGAITCYQTLRIGLDLICQRQFNHRR
jgi:hypothetical protein